MFEAIDDEMIAVSRRRRLHVLEAGAHVGFRYDDRRQELAAREARNVFLLLRWGSELEQRALSMKRQGQPRKAQPPEFFGDNRHFDGA